MDVYISTVDRTQKSPGHSLSGRRNYLEDTLRHLGRSAWLGRAYLFFNTPRTDYASSDLPNVSKMPVDEQEYRLLARKEPHYRATHNYWRMLSHRSGPCVILEDDVEVAENWYEMLVYTIHEVERQHDRYMLSLYCCYESSVQSSGYAWPYDPDSFYGTQGMFYPESVRGDLSRHLLERGVRDFAGPYDLTIKRFCRDQGIPMFACRRSLLQHTAPADSTGLGGGHQTRTFQARIEHPPAARVYQARPGKVSQTSSGCSITLAGAKHPIICNGPAALVWSLCDGEKTTGELSHELEDYYPEEHNRIMRDVCETADDLESRLALRQTGERPRIRSMEISASLERFCGCRFTGQLGNQLFQIAATLSHAQRHNLIPLFPEWDYGRVFDHALVHIDALPGNGWIYSEPEFSYRALPAEPGIVLDGYFQSARYFDEPTVRKFLSPSPSIIAALRRRYRRLLEVKPVSLHVRRGDYLGMPESHPVLPATYYLDAMTQFGEHRVFAVFSDDMAWCRSNLPSDNLVFVENQPHHEDLFLMALCEDHIIANSTFSWWGAWLNPNPGKTVIAPTLWFGGGNSHLDTTDLIPREWTRIAC